MIRIPTPPTCPVPPLQMYNRRNHKDMFGHVLPPLAGSNPSILVADIEARGC